MKVITIIFKTVFSFLIEIQKIIPQYLVKRGATLKEYHNRLTVHYSQRGTLDNKPTARPIFATTMNTSLSPHNDYYNIRLPDLCKKTGRFSSLILTMCMPYACFSANAPNSMINYQDECCVEANCFEVVSSASLDMICKTEAHSANEVQMEQQPSANSITSSCSDGEPVVAYNERKIPVTKAIDHIAVSSHNHFSVGWRRVMKGANKWPLYHQNYFNINGMVCHSPSSFINIYRSEGLPRLDGSSEFTRERRSSIGNSFSNNLWYTRKDRNKVVPIVNRGLQYLVCRQQVFAPIVQYSRIGQMKMKLPRSEPDSPNELEYPARSRQSNIAEMVPQSPRPPNFLI